MPERYSIRSVPGKGQGMIANMDIEAGTRILAEDLLFTAPDNVLDEGIEERIRSSLDRLPPEQQQQFEALHCPGHPKLTPLVSRFLANAFETEKAQESGIFLEASRVNHSCSPNAHWAWNDNLRRLTIHAMVDIPAGEEITVNYDYAFVPLAQRQKRLRQLYRFDCACPACQLDAAHDRRAEQWCRQRMETLCAEIQKHRRVPSEDDGELSGSEEPRRAPGEDDRAMEPEELALVLEFIELAEDARMAGHFMASMYERASMGYEARGDPASALRYAEMELGMEARLHGDDHPNTMDCAETVARLRLEAAGKEALV